MIALEVRLRPFPESLSEAREALSTLDVAPDIKDDVRLMASELLTNSIRHGGLIATDEICLRILRIPSGLRIEVTDAGRGFLHSPPRPRADGQEGGWGLLLVDRLADRWGVETSEDGLTTVWCEVDLEPPREGARPVGEAIGTTANDLT